MPEYRTIESRLSAFGHHGPRTLGVVACFALAVVLFGDAAHAKTEPIHDGVAGVHTLRSRHYELHADGTKERAAEHLRLLEAAWPVLTKFFGRMPGDIVKTRLVVKHLATKARWRDALQADGIQPPKGAGGYFVHRTKTVYLHDQPTVYYTRQLLLHECMHQFHFLAATGNKSLRDRWYVEGLVEYLSRHTWDGEDLRLGVTPFITLKDFPAEATEQLAAQDYDLRGMIDGSYEGTRAAWWALVRYLEVGADKSVRKGWARLRHKLDRGGKAGSQFANLVAKPRVLLPNIRAWLQTQQEPLVWLWNQWVPVGPASVEGHSRFTCACHVRTDCREIACMLDRPKGKVWRAGLLLCYVDNNDYTVAYLTQSGAVIVQRRLGKRWKTLLQGKVARPGPRIPLRAHRTRKGVVFSVGQAVVGTLALPPGKMGLALDNCRARFRAIKWK